MGVSRHKEINAINLIVLQAEQDIYAETGRQVRLIIAPDMMNTERKNAVGMFRLICAVQNLLPSEVRQDGQRDDLVRTRQLFYYFARKQFKNTSYEQLGVITGGQDHSTVVYGIAQVEKRISITEDGFMEDYEAVKDAVEQWLNDK